MMRRSDNHATSMAPSTGTSGGNPPRRRRHSHNTSTITRIVVVVVLLVVILQAVLLPWIIVPAASSSGLEGGSAAVIEPPGNPLGQQPHREFRRQQGPPDATLNGVPVYRKQDEFHSTIHCVGETHHSDTAWMYRSCEFTNLCLDVVNKEFYVVESPMEQQFQQRRVNHSFISTELSPSTASNVNLTLALGGINPRWLGKGFVSGIEKVRWFPRRLAKPPSTYYVLDDNIVLVPFHSFAAHNVGHMLWDDFLPIFTLLQLFGWMDDSTARNSADSIQHLLLRVDTLPLLYGTCDIRKNKHKKCAANFQKFLPMLGVDPQTFSTVKELTWSPTSSTTKSDSSPTFVCSKHAVAGLGMLTDHGMKDHGWLPSKEQSVQNTAKGMLLYQFRNNLLRNMDLPLVPPRSNRLNIVLSAHSSADDQRDTSFDNQQRVLQKAFPAAQVRTVQLSEMGMREQVELVSQQTQVFISTCGGGSMTATFLPKGATLILYYAENGGFDFANDLNSTNGPAYLDWDLFNNMAYLRVHWLPIGTMDTEAGLRALMFLINHEVDVASSGV